MIRDVVRFRLMKVLTLGLNSAVVMRDTAHSQSLMFDYVNRLRLKWSVLRLTLINENDEVRFSWSEVICIIAHFQMIF